MSDLFGRTSVRESDSDRLYSARVNRKANLFEEDDTQEDDTQVDDLDLAAEMLTYDKPDLKTWKPKPSATANRQRKPDLFTDNTAELEEAQTEKLLAVTENVVKNVSQVQPPAETKQSTVTPKQEKSSETSAASVSKEVEDLLAKLDKSDPFASANKPADINAADFDVSAYITQNTQSQKRGLFD